MEGSAPTARRKRGVGATSIHGAVESRGTEPIVALDRPRDHVARSFPHDRRAQALDRRPGLGRLVRSRDRVVASIPECGSTFLAQGGMSGWVANGQVTASTGTIHLVASERARREQAYKRSAAAVLAYINHEDADLYNLLDEASKTAALGASDRLAFLAAKSLEELAAATGEAPSEILDRIIEQSHRYPRS